MKTGRGLGTKLLDVVLVQSVFGFKAKLRFDQLM